VRNLFLKYWPVIFFVAAGLAGGFLYWRFIGCNSGSCPITSDWHISSFTGGLIGYLGGSSITDILRKRKN